MTAADSNVDNAGRGKFPETVRLALENGSLQGIEFWPETTAPGKDEQVLNEIAYRKPDILIVPPEVSIEDGLAVAAKVDREYPQLSVVLVGEKTADLYERAFRAGARGLIDPAASVSEIRQTLEELQDATRRRQSAIGGDASETTLNRVVPVLAAKGGVGKTTLASNLAASLAFSNPGEVVIVDLDLQFGDVASTLGITPESTISDTVRFGTDLDGATVKAFLTPALDGKLFALAAPDLPAHADELTPQHVAHVLTLLRRDFPFVVIDTAAGIDEFTLEALDAATDIALLTSMDVPSVRATAKEIDALVLLGMERLAWHVVLNRSNAKVGLTIDDVEETIGYPIDVRIPSTRSVALSVNHGVPLVQSDPKLPAAKAYGELADRVARVAPERRGLLKRRNR